MTTVLITGASGGIGHALAVQYAQPGYTLVLHGRDQAKLQALARQCEDQGACCVVLAFDLSDARLWIASLNSLVTKFPVDLAFVNAGVATTQLERAETWDEAQHTLDINLSAAIATVTALSPHMVQRGSGQMVLISSLAALVGMPLTPAYCASKAGLRAYGQAMRGLLGASGVGVTVVLPGFVDTGMSKKFPAGKLFMVSPQWAARHIQKRLHRNPPQISFPQPLVFGMWCLAVMPATWSQWILQRLGYAATHRAIPAQEAD